MGVQLRFGATILVAALLGADASPAMAQKSADTLRISMRAALSNIDPYYNNERTGVVMHHQGWDALVYRNPDTFKLEPLLATEWNAAGYDYDRIHPAARREIPRRQRVHR